MAYKNLLTHMKKLSFIILSAIVLSGFLFGCNNSGSTPKETKEIDSILTRLRLIDSLQNSGTYCHLEAWNIGRVIENGYKEYSSLADKHSVNVYANKLSFANDTLFYVTLEYNINSDYSSRYETKYVDVKEIKAFCSAIDDIKKNYDKKSDHFELFQYHSKGEAKIFLKHYADSDYKLLQFCSIDIVESDLDELKQILLKAEKKIEELR